MVAEECKICNLFNFLGLLNTVVGLGLYDICSSKRWIRSRSRKSDLRLRGAERNILGSKTLDTASSATLSVNKCYRINNKKHGTFETDNNSAYLWK
jgi:hypothetical protein